jgi:hypothetical protein
MFTPSNIRKSVEVSVDKSSRRIRLYCGLSMPGRPAKKPFFSANECFVDTGSPYTIIPEKVWKHILTDVGAPDTVVPFVGGASIPAKDAKVNIELISGEVEDRPNPIILYGFDVMLAFDQQNDPRPDYQIPVILLGFDTLKCGGLCINLVDGDGHLIET